VNLPSQLLALARKAATAQSLDPALVCAVVEQESAWNPWAMRYEPAFFSKYVAPLYTNNKIAATEAYSRGFSWGLMQVMGQVARENGFDALFLSALCDPEQGLAVGCKVLRKKFDAMTGDTTRAPRLERRREHGLHRPSPSPPRALLVITFPPTL
jgi:soluble lytic murein transglycosylase-like protein